MDTASQSKKILGLLKQRLAKNWELAGISLKYSSRISELRHDGHNIQAFRIWKDGKATGTYEYKLMED